MNSIFNLYNSDDAFTWDSYIGLGPNSLFIPILKQE